MKTLFTGGIKSGKSRLAEAYILERSASRTPFYIATTEFIDTEMAARIAIHQERRQNQFKTIEEPLKLLQALENCSGPTLVECVSMWLNNALYHQISETKILQELEAIMQLPGDIVLVHNEVGYGVIPDNPLARQFVDLSGKAAQLMGEYCDQVFLCCAGLKLAMK